MAAMLKATDAPYAKGVDACLWSRHSVPAVTGRRRIVPQSSSVTRKEGRGGFPCPDPSKAASRVCPCPRNFPPKEDEVPGAAFDTSSSGIKHVRVDPYCVFDLYFRDNEGKGRHR